MQHITSTDFPAFENRDFYVELGEHIAFYRKQAHMTQAELAKRIHVTRTYLSKVESTNIAQSFSLEMLFNISRELNIPLKDFFVPFEESL